MWLNRLLILRFIILLIVLSFIRFIIAANGPCKADKGDSRIPEAISADGYDCKSVCALYQTMLYLPGEVNASIFVAAFFVCMCRLKWCQMQLMMLWIMMRLRMKRKSWQIRWFFVSEGNTRLVYLSFLFYHWYRVMHCTEIVITYVKNYHLNRYCIADNNFWTFISIIRVLNHWKHILFPILH